MANITPEFNHHLSIFLNELSIYKPTLLLEPSNNIQQLQGFFDHLKALNLSMPDKEVIKIPQKDELLSFFDEYQTVYEELQIEIKQGAAVNVWQAANLGRNEVRNSKTLRWFLDRYETHGQADYFLKIFLNCLDKQCSQWDTSVYHTTEECCPLGEQTERVDIEIDGKEFLLFIEVKIDAGQGENQLERYLKVASKKSQGREWYVIYLTCDGKVPYLTYDGEVLDPDKKIIGVSWKIFANKLKEVTKLETKHHVMWLANQFADHILTF